jgi:hypothetical protein
MRILPFSLLFAAVAPPNTTPVLYQLGKGEQTVLCASKAPDFAVVLSEETCAKVGEEWVQALSTDLRFWEEPPGELPKPLRGLQPNVRRAVSLRKQIIADGEIAARLLKGREARKRLASTCWPRHEYIPRDRWSKTGEQVFFVATNEPVDDMTADETRDLGAEPEVFEARLCSVDSSNGKVRSFPALLQNVGQVIAGRRGTHILLEIGPGSWLSLETTTGNTTIWKQPHAFVGILNDRQTLLTCQPNQLFVFDHVTGRRTMIATIPPGITLVGLWPRSTYHVDVVASSKKARTIIALGFIDGDDGMKRQRVISIHYAEGSHDGQVSILDTAGWGLDSAMFADEPLFFPPT